MIGGNICTWRCAFSAVPSLPGRTGTLAERVLGDNLSRAAR